jgi:hypothetical protein
MNISTLAAYASVGFLFGTFAFCYDDIKKEYEAESWSRFHARQADANHKKTMDRLTFKTFESKVELCSAKLRIGIPC